MSRILLVDDDTEARLALATALSRPHRTLASAGDGREALDLAASFRPHLVITDVVMPGVDGWALVRALRTRRDTALTSVIFTTALAGPASRVAGLRLGAVDYVTKPIDLTELELRVENALHFGARARDMVVAALSGGLAGSLSLLGLSSILNVLALDRKTGELRVALAAREAKILLRDGNVVLAETARGRGPSGVECVYELLGWDDGAFAFAERPVDVEDTIRMPTIALLMEGARRADEASR